MAIELRPAVRGASTRRWSRGSDPGGRPVGVFLFAAALEPARGQHPHRRPPLLDAQPGDPPHPHRRGEGLACRSPKRKRGVLGARPSLTLRAPTDPSDSRSQPRDDDRMGCPVPIPWRVARMLRPALFALLLCTAAAPAAEPAVVLRPDVPYADLGSEKLRLDVADPATPGPHPAVVCLHGGAWKSGSRKDLSRASAWTTSASPARASSRCWPPAGSWRSASATGSPRRTSSRPRSRTPRRPSGSSGPTPTTFGIDPDRIAALGFSAGGHLAALLGTADESAGFDGDAVPGAVEPGAVRGGLLRPVRPDPVRRDAGGREGVTSCRCWAAGRGTSSTCTSRRRRSSTSRRTTRRS